MSENNRIKQLLSFLKEDPNDPFTIYALATEYQNIDMHQAMVYFEELLEKHPDYTATYYHAALLYAELEEIEKAKSTFEEGIRRCQAANEAKALQEIKNAYDNFLFEIE